MGCTTLKPSKQPVINSAGLSVLCAKSSCNSTALLKLRIRDRRLTIKSLSAFWKQMKFNFLNQMREISLLKKIASSHNNKMDRHVGEKKSLVNLWHMEIHVGTICQGDS